MQIFSRVAGAASMIVVPAGPRVARRGRGTVTLVQLRQYRSCDLHLRGADAARAT